jgi:putative transposase
MARQWRIEFKGGIYHILSRGNQRQIIFRDDQDREMFIDLLGDASIRFSIEIYAYVLMDNHYHILLKTKKPNLSKAMQWIGSTYTRRFNITHQQNGHLFQGRFKSILVENETYLLRLSYYIHRNPLRAGIVSRLADYPWSSYQAYAYKKAFFPNWLQVRFILSKFSSKDQHRSYRMKAQNYSDENKKIWEDVTHGLIFGSERFIERIKTKFLKEKKEPELTQHNRLKFETNIDKLIDQMSEVLNFNILEKKMSRHSSQESKECRDLVVFFLKKHTDLSNRSIGDKLNLTGSAVGKIISSFQIKINNNKKLEKRAKDFDSHFQV